ncbi:FecR domain-containing protein [Polyangium jinanense]|uniref:FecR domain-containing protein n=1 Tax=Polyangium jinanense TaxID=2829994 RepID=A0A9X4AV79_9BACT|nr:FecR domain-containing protein [Polyangium jinanense]MDC3960539.1 FecR domain-containing protein [Polyangium jinanense]MDC3985401.1 FecR domain-containing protein [Polyangium jinanense]
MDDEMKQRLERLGRAVADVSDASADRGALDAARSRFLAPTPQAPESARRKGIVAGLALAAACAGAFALYVATRTPALSFTVGASPVQGVAGDWIAAGETSLGLRFSEGSALTLAPGARVRVTETNPRGAAVLIESGAVHAEITHAHDDTRWALRAGPFEVRITGTAFDARWDPATETFEVAMMEGSVIATGPLLREGRALVPGERLRVSVRESKLEIQEARTATKSTNEPAPPGPSSVQTNPSAPILSPSASAAMPVAPVPEESSAQPGWRELASAGKYKDALAAAERAGFSQEVERASAADLFALADAARFAGSPARAREALMAARRRFGDRGRSAFLIGKIAADQQRSPGEAATWFETYLREEPGGQLAEQALGRLLEIRRRGDPAAARAIAKRYLARYPQGAYAALARSVLEP